MSPKVLIPTYEPLETVKCKKCSKVIAEPEELIRIKKWNLYKEQQKDKER